MFAAGEGQRLSRAPAARHTEPVSGPLSPPPGAPAWDPEPPGHARSDRRWTAIGAAAVVVLVVGTFLPWIRSGRVQRNSYEIAGVGVRRLDAGSAVTHLLQAWPFLGPLWAVVVILVILGRRRIAAAVALVLAVLTGLVALGGLVLAVRLDTTMLGGTVLGPAVTLIGAIGVAVAGVGMLRRRPRQPPRLRSPTG